MAKASALSTAELICERQVQLCLNPMAVAVLDVELDRRNGNLFHERDELEALRRYGLEVPRP
jgi:hypothetical protein